MGYSQWQTDTVTPNVATGMMTSAASATSSFATITRSDAVSSFTLFSPTSTAVPSVSEFGHDTSLPPTPASQTPTSPAAAPNADPSSSTNNKNTTSFSTSQIVGTAIGATGGIALIAAAGIFFVRRRRQTPSSPASVTVPSSEESKVEEAREWKAVLSVQIAMPPYNARLGVGGVCKLDGGGVVARGGRWDRR
ncbi:hypothetical protein BU23DRAFT_135040 [Bimuria novae-zelandiae CBS 107.79]|uniref:Mid2 domain-containing protein n=1 Tax=Bimuria novae-zelandiae CBS 107.79 TaxID=1447943 RepID=A0A6A5V877_9PLEO|nr:hypothetical protein BU23DRAFT_135040 [Bimuria novae-zelandiae CBS 107.79]